MWPLAFRTLILSLALALAAQPASAAEHDWVLTCNGSSRWFPPDANLEALQQTFGEENVQVGDVEAGGGEMTRGAVLYGNDPEHRVEVVWKDGKESHGIEMVTIAGNVSTWHTCEGVTIGTRLKRLEQLNGKPFRLSGLGWDYSGGVSDWQGGKLAASFKNVFLFLDGEGSVAAYDQVSGDKPFVSSFPAMQTVNPAVYKMGMSYLAKPSTSDKASTDKSTAKSN